MKNPFFIICLVLAGLLTNSCTKELPTRTEVSTMGETMMEDQDQQVQIATFILVRHAEKGTTGTNPSLTEAGKNRAIELSKLLELVEVDAVFSTNYNRTLETAQPAATAKNMEVTLYDPSDLNAFAESLLKDTSNSTKLIVGHSNTTPDLINILMKEKQLDHLSEKEYDHLFILTLLGDGSTKLLPLKYGAH